MSKSIERMLIPLDGSEESETILDAAAELSSLTAAERTLIRVVPLLPYAGVPWTEKEDEALSYLNRIAVKLRGQPSAVHTEIVSSDNALGEVLLANAQASRVDLIAVTSRRGGGPWERFVRSPVNYLIGRAHVPILVVRATPRSDDARCIQRDARIAQTDRGESGNVGSSRSNNHVTATDHHHRRRSRSFARFARLPNSLR